MIVNVIAVCYHICYYYFYFKSRAGLKKYEMHGHFCFFLPDKYSLALELLGELVLKVTAKTFWSWNMCFSVSSVQSMWKRNSFNVMLMSMLIWNFFFTGILNCLIAVYMDLGATSKNGIAVFTSSFMLWSQIQYMSALRLHGDAHRQYRSKE